MKYILTMILLVVGMPALAESPAQSPAQSPVRVSNAYAYATAEVQKNGAAFMRIENAADAAVQITSAESDISESVELHTHIMDGDMMMMREVEQFDIEANGAIALEPMGKHIMFMGLKAPLKEGETFPLTLFMGGQSVTADVEVVAPGTKPGDVQ